MMKILASCLLLTIAASSARGGRLELPSFSSDLMVEVGLDTDVQPPPPHEDPCSNLSVSWGMKYSDDEQNVLDVATPSGPPSMPRPVMLFVAGQSFENDGTSADWAMRKNAICLAARNGMVGVSISYRRAPAHDWPAGARDVAAAISWVYENIDLFGGDRHEIVAIGYSAGAFHLATFLAHRELQNADSNIAAAVLLSGIYSPGADADMGEQAYLGANTNLYKARSALPGILEVEKPIVLAWSVLDPPALVAQAENLREHLCKAGHCPRTALLADRGSPASVFERDSGDQGLAERMRQLISQIEARGLP